MDSNTLKLPSSALFLDRGRGRQPATGQPNTASVATKYERINMFSESVIARPY